MTPQESLTLLDRLAAGVAMTRDQHATVAQAVHVLATAITPAPVPEQLGLGL